MPNSLLHRARRAVPLALAGALAACDLPSEAPILQQTWVVPADSLSVGVSDLLPANVSLTGGGSAFLVNIPAPGAFSSTLGALCGLPECQSPGTVTANVPAFISPGAELTQLVTFPATVTAATVTGGTLALAVNNQLGFDPLRPNGASAPYGSVLITVTNGAASSGTTFTGSTQGLPNGAVTVLQVPVPAGTYADRFSVRVTFNVPAGGSAALSAANGITITPSVTGLTVSQATVVVNGEPISAAPQAFDFEDADFADQVEGGGLLIDITNPFTASAALTLSLQAPAQGGSPAVLITRPVAVPATPTSSVTVSFTKAELQSLVGRSGVTMSLAGSASGTGAGNTVSVTPSQRISLRTSLQLIINVGA